MDTAVVEDKVHAGKLLPRLLGLEVEFDHSLITCTNDTEKEIYSVTRLNLFLEF